jgi:hypothetical protein
MQYRKPPPGLLAEPPATWHRRPMPTAVRVANASGYWGDDPEALAHQPRGGSLDQGLLLLELDVPEPLAGTPPERED